LSPLVSPKSGHEETARAATNPEKFAYGGQAVIEGVMIRGKKAVVTACRLPNQEILLHEEEPRSLVQRYRWLAVPFVRGTPALIDALRIGFRSLMFSADVAIKEEQGKPVSPWAYALTVGFALILGVGVFVVLPTVLVPRGQAPKLTRSLAEAGIRLGFLVAYIAGISLMANVRRVFQYHGAEHKVINAYERTGRYDPEGAAAFGTIHPRCGTSFLLMVVAVGIIVHALIWPESVPVRMALRLFMLVPVAGISYELIRLAGRHHESRLLGALVAPGTWLQMLTTKEPTPDQVEVASRALQAALAADGILPVANRHSETAGEAGEELPSPADVRQEKLPRCSQDDQVTP
jgi:uncharacterized protein YqhQ